MVTTTFLYMFMAFVITTNGQTTQSPLITVFMNYTVEYQDFDTDSCIATTTSTSTTTTTSTSTTTTTSTSTTTTTITSTSTTTTTTTTTTSTSTTSTTTTATTASTTTMTTTATATTTTATATSTTTTTTTSTTTTTTTSITTTTTTTSTTTTTTTSTTTTTTTSITTTTTTTSTTTTTTTTSITTTTTTTSTTTTTATTSSTTTSTQTSTIFTNMSTTKNSVFVPKACPNETMGTSCNISSNPCTLTQPCLNSATCYPNSTIPSGYYCECVSAYTGVNCETYTRVCQEDSSCLYGGTCNETETSLSCACPDGKTGEYCQWQVNLCANITCQNNGKCVANYTTWSCLCVNTEYYSGTYCEIKSAGLRIKQLISRSLSGVAIASIATVIGFFLIMDILKYVFNIDVSGNDLRMYRNRRRREIRKRKKKVPKRPTVIQRVYYIQ